MSRTIRSLSASIVVMIVTACTSVDEDADSSNAVCAPGQSIACVGPASCKGFQICREDQSGYDPCDCSSNPTGTRAAAASTATKTGSPTSSSGGTAAIQANGGAHFTSTGGIVGSSALGTGITQLGSGGISAAGGTAANFAGTSAQTSAATASTCAPANMSNYAYPPYKPARRLAASCAEQELQRYYDECYVKGSCAAFQTGGSYAACGACLSPSSVDAAEYGPLIRLGAPGSSLDITNMAGCIELMGEADCAKPTMVASLCDYYACATNCPAADAASYQAQMTCMASARSSSCSSAWSASVCVRDPAHAAACSGSGFLGQFLATARVFCAQNH